MNNTTENRDQLALERTKLANERTLLAYIRTGLSLLAAAALLLHFSSTVSAYVPLAGVTAIAGLLIIVVGSARFTKVKQSLQKTAT